MALVSDFWGNLSNVVGRMSCEKPVPSWLLGQPFSAEWRLLSLSISDRPSEPAPPVLSFPPTLQPAERALVVRRRAFAAVQRPFAAFAGELGPPGRICDKTEGVSSGTSMIGDGLWDIASSASGRMASLSGHAAGGTAVGMRGCRS